MSNHLRRVAHLLGHNGQKPSVSVAGRPKPAAPEPPVARKKGRPRQAVVPDDTHDWNRFEPEILEGDCSAADLVFALENLNL